MEEATAKTLGRGMVCHFVENIDDITEITSFVKLYQKNTGLLIGSLEEIAYKKGIIDKEQLRRLTSGKPYKELLEKACIEYWTT